MELKCNLPNIYLMLLFLSVLTQVLVVKHISYVFFLFVNFWIVDGLDGDELRERNDVSNC